MIEHAWYDVVPADAEAEVRGLLAVCAALDAEAGFSRPGPPGAGGRHLLVWLLPDERWGGGELGARRLAGYLRVEGGEAAYVVHPELRSRGITTLLVETGALAGEAFTIWARNNHPAAVRLAARFGIATARREWQLLAPLRRAPALPADVRSPERGDDLDVLWGVGSPPKAEVLVGTNGAVWFDPAAGEATEYGPAGRIYGVRGGPARSLLAGAMAALRGAGLGVTLFTIGSTERDLVHEARTLGFRHDQTDVQYRIS